MDQIKDSEQISLVKIPGTSAKAQQILSELQIDLQVMTRDGGDLQITGYCYAFYCGVSAACGTLGAEIHDALGKAVWDTVSRDIRIPKDIDNLETYEHPLL